MRDIDAVVERLARTLNRHYTPEISGRRVNWSHHTADDKEAYRADARMILDSLSPDDLNLVVVNKCENDTTLLKEAK